MSFWREVFAWAAIFMAVAFMIHWNRLEDRSDFDRLFLFFVFAVAFGAGLAYLRRNWKR